MKQFIHRSKVKPARPSAMSNSFGPRRNRARGDRACRRRASDRRPRLVRLPAPVRRNASRAARTADDVDFDSPLMRLAAGGSASPTQESPPAGERRSAV
jgi:hypothetical protein